MQGGREGVLLSCCSAQPLCITLFTRWPSSCVPRYQPCGVQRRSPFFGRWSASTAGSPVVFIFPPPPSPPPAASRAGPSLPCPVVSRLATLHASTTPAIDNQIDLPQFFFCVFVNRRCRRTGIRSHALLALVLRVQIHCRSCRVPCASIAALFSCWSIRRWCCCCCSSPSRSRPHVPSTPLSGFYRSLAGEIVQRTNTIIIYVCYWTLCSLCITFPLPSFHLISASILLHHTPPLKSYSPAHPPSLASSVTISLHLSPVLHLASILG